MRLMACLGAGEAFGGATYREPNLPLAAQFLCNFGGFVLRIGMHLYQRLL